MTQHDDAPAMALIRDITGAIEQARERDHAPLVREAAAARGWTVTEGGPDWTLADGDGHVVAVRFDDLGRVEELTARISP